MGNTILVVDDEKDIILMARLLLEGEGYSVLEASGGEEALAVIDAKALDAVLLDLSMPNISGWDVLRELRAQGKLEDQPVIVLSAHSDDQTAQESITLGAKTYVRKPFRKADLLGAIESVLSR